jgi:hypothetical protein
MLLSTVIFLLLFSSFSVAATPRLRRDPIHIPLLRRNYIRRGNKGDVSRYARVAAGLRRKYKYGSSLSRRGQSQDFDLTDDVRHMSGIPRPRFITHKDNNRVKI